MPILLADVVWVWAGAEVADLDEAEDLDEVLVGPESLKVYLPGEVE